MSSAYEKMRRVACRVASYRGDKPYAAVAARFAAKLEELNKRGDLSPDERAALWLLVDPDVDTAPAPVDSPEHPTG
jgi:hypothetical protein